MYNVKRQKHTKKKQNKKKLSYVNLTKLVSTDISIAMAMIAEYHKLQFWHTRTAAQGYYSINGSW